MNILQLLILLETEFKGNGTAASGNHGCNDDDNSCRSAISKLVITDKGSFTHIILDILINLNES